MLPAGRATSLPQPPRKAAPPPPPSRGGRTANLPPLDAQSERLGRLGEGKNLRLADLGCGEGSLTKWLHQELGAAETLGVKKADTVFYVPSVPLRCGMGGVNWRLN